MKKFIFSVISVLIILNLSFVYANDTIKCLKESDIVKISIENNPAIKAAQEKLSGSESNAEGSGKWPNPELFIGPNWGTIEDQDSIILSQIFDLSGKHDLKRKKADFNVLYIKTQLQETCLEIGLKAKVKYYDYCTAVQVLNLQKKNIEIYRNVIEKADIQYNLGNIPQADVLRLQLEESKIEQDLIRAENQVEISKSTLFNIMGIDDETTEIYVPPAEEVLTEIKELKLEDLITSAGNNRPLIAGQKSLIQAKEYEIKIAQADRYPDLIVSYRRDNFDPVCPEGGDFKFALPLFDYGSIDAQVEEAKASQREEEAVLSSIKFQVKLEVQSAYYEFKEFSYMLKAFKDKMLKNSDDLLWKAQYGYEEGAFSYLEFMDAMRTYNEVQSEYIKTLYNYYGALAKCERATGTKFGK